jgi:polyisoprenoid-binding protein YceI
MKKIAILSAVVLMASSATFAQKFLTRTGKITFDATTKTSPEAIKGVNGQVACIVDVETGHMALSLVQKSFKFKKELMEEHFNENYMESEKYPKATLDGTITNLSEVNLKANGKYNAKVSGKLSMHGETKDFSTTGTITIEGDKMTLNSKFNVNLADFNIKVPDAVSDKVAKVVTVTLEADLVKK